MGFEDLAREFATPGRAARPGIYLFAPEVSAIEPGKLAGAIEQVAAAGFGAVNLFDLELAPTADRNDLLRTALAAARHYKIAVDLTIHNMAKVPEIHADGGADQRELVYGTVSLDGGATYTGAVPIPPDAPDRPRSLVAVVAARQDGPGILDRDSLTDLTERAEGDLIGWTAPAGDAAWLVFGIWHRSTDSPYADYLSEAGTKVMTGHWDEHVFTPGIQELVAEVADTLMEDSLHLQGHQLWTPDLLGEFERQRAYSLRRFLPVLFIPQLNDWVANTFLSPQTRSPETPPDYDFADDTGLRIRNDYYQTLSELYEEHHVRALNGWARSHGLKYRPKPAYNASLDISAAASADLPMTENFVMGNRLDGIRGIAGAAHLGRKDKLVVEVAPTTTQVGHDLYSTTWKQTLSAIHGTFAAGANHAELHSFAYPDGPGSFGPTPDNADESWPGFWSYRGTSQPAVLGPLGLAEAYGPRMPYWHHAPDITAFLAREQFVLQQGRPRVDVAIYRHSYWSHGFPYTANHRAEDHFYWFTDTTLEQRGYTYEFVGPALFGLPNAQVKNGRLDLDGPAYKALVLDRGAQRNSVRGMPLAAARAVLGYARAGLPVVAVGDLPDRTGFYSDIADDPKVLAELQALLELPNVRHVPAETDVVAALAALGVRADFTPTAPSNTRSVHRSSDTADFYFLYNQNGVNNMTGAPEPEPAPFDQTISLAGTGRPFALNAWTGEITPIAAYQHAEDGRTTTRVRLEPGETTLIALLHTASPSTITLANWQLSIEDWQPGSAPSETRKTHHRLDLPSLTSWLNIPELQNVSGIGRYITYIDLGPEWTHGHIHLDLGLISDSVRVRINGRPLPPLNPFAPRTDVTPYLRTGSNTVEVEVATTLRNRLRTLPTHPEYHAAEPQPYGLTGPVRLIPCPPPK